MAQVYAAKYLAKAAMSAPRDLVRSAVARYTPLHPTVFIFHCTFVCDARCEMCSNWTRGNRKEDMTLAQIEQVFSSNLWKDIENASISGGEPTTRNDLVVMAAVGVLAWTPQGRSDWRIAAAIVVMAAACGAAFWSNELLRWIIPAHRHHGFLTRRILKLADAVGRYRRHRGVLLHVMAWSLVVQVLRITQAYLLGLGLGMSVPYAYYLLFMPLGLLMLLVPISISGFGVPQGVIVWLLRPMGVPDALSFALSTLIVLTGLAGNLPGLILWLRDRRTPG